MEILDLFLKKKRKATKIEKEIEIVDYSFWY